MADDLGDVDFDDDEGWETEDDMQAEAEQDDSELTFSKHTGKGRAFILKGETFPSRPSLLL